ncbi:dihydroorotate dehydrogenase electron transfer subunit [Acidobacteriota bacterium]
MPYSKIYRWFRELGGGFRFCKRLYIKAIKWDNWIMKEEKCKVVENIKMNEKYYLMKIKTTTIAKDCRPGHFVMVAVSTTFDPLLKRPFGIFKSEPPYIYIYYEVVGKGSELLSRLKENDQLAVLDPLGNSFPEPQNKNLLLIAGSRGITPIYFAAEKYARGNTLFLVYGAKSSDDLNLLDRIDSLPLKKKYLYTDDGSAGKKGLVSDDIREIVKENQIAVTFSCGPDAMFKSLNRELTGLELENYVSLETLMGCGFGICYSCAVKTRDSGYKKVCSDGPVFKLENIEW